MLQQHLLAVVVVFAVVALIVTVAAVLFQRVSSIPNDLLAVGAMAVLGLLGWLAFGAWFVDPKLGVCFTVLVLIGVTGMAIRDRRDIAKLCKNSPELCWQSGLICCVALVYVGHLHLFETELGIEPLAANRYLERLPIDNSISRIFADRVIDRTDSATLVGDWLSSDRAPLQTGLILWFHPIGQLFGFSHKVFAHATAFTFQLFWIPAVWAFCAHLRLRTGVIVALIATLGISATPLINSNYVWPKLAAAAALLGAYTVYFRNSPHPPGTNQVVLSVVLAALAWLSHGGVAFALVALVPLIALHRPPKAKSAATAVGIGFLLVLPWFAYQNLYDPPGNRLLKWHLAGVIDIDPRGFPATLIDSYEDSTLEEIVANKRANFRYPFIFASHGWASFPSNEAASNRVNSFYFLFSSLGPWNVAWLGLAWVAWRWFRQLPSNLRTEDDRRNWGNWFRPAFWTGSTFPAAGFANAPDGSHSKDSSRSFCGFGRLAVRLICPSLGATHCRYR